MPEKDSVTREISLMVQVVSRALFGKSEPAYETQNPESPTPGDCLHLELRRLIQENRIPDAENALFEALESGIGNLLDIAMDFYYRLSLLSDDELIEGGFSREEIDQGLRDLLGECGIEVPQIPE